MDRRLFLWSGCIFAGVAIGLAATLVGGVLAELLRPPPTAEPSPYPTWHEPFFEYWGWMVGLGAGGWLAGRKALGGLPGVALAAVGAGLFAYGLAGMGDGVLPLVDDSRFVIGPAAGLAVLAFGLAR